MPVATQYTDYYINSPAVEPTVAVDDNKVDSFVAVGNRIVVQNEKEEYDWSKYPGGYSGFLSNLEKAKTYQKTREVNTSIESQLSSVDRPQSERYAQLKREADFTAQQRWLETPEGHMAIERFQEPYIQEAQRLEGAKSIMGPPASLKPEIKQEPQPNTQSPSGFFETENSGFPDPSREREANYFHNPRALTSEEQEAQRQAAENYEAAFENILNPVRDFAKEKLASAEETKSRGDFLGTMAAVGAYTLGKLSVGAAEAITFPIRPTAWVNTGRLVVDSGFRDKAVAQMAADPSGTALELIGGVIGGVALGKGIGYAKNKILGPTGKLTRLAEVKVEQTPVKPYMDEAGNLYTINREVTTTLTPKLETLKLSREQFALMEKTGSNVDTVFGYTKNKGYKSGYQIKLTTTEYDTLMSGKQVSDPFLKGGQLGLDKVQFPDVYATVKGEAVKGGGLQYWKEVGPSGPYRGGEVGVINMGNFKLRVTAALEAEPPLVNPADLIKPTGMKTPWYTDLWPNQGDAAALNKLISTNKLPPILGKVTKVHPDIDVFAGPPTRAEAVSKMAPAARVAATSGFSQTAFEVGTMGGVSGVNAARSRLDLRPTMESRTTPDLLTSIYTDEITIPKLDQKQISHLDQKQISHLDQPKKEKTITIPNLDVSLDLKMKTPQTTIEFSDLTSKQQQRQRQIVDSKSKYGTILAPGWAPPFTPTHRRFTPPLLPGVGGGGWGRRKGYRKRIQSVELPSTNDILRGIGLKGRKR